MASLTLGPGVLDLAGIRAGDRNLIEVRLKRAGVALDLTGQVLSAQARKVATDPGPPAITAVITVTNAAQGIATMRWDGSEVRALLAGAATWDGVWDMQVGPLTDDDIPVTVLAGKFGAVTDVTRQEIVGTAATAATTEPRRIRKAS